MNKEFKCVTLQQEYLPLLMVDPKRRIYWRQKFKLVAGDTFDFYDYQYTPKKMEFLEKLMEKLKIPYDRTWEEEATGRQGTSRVRPEGSRCCGISHLPLREFTEEESAILMKYKMKE